MPTSEQATELIDARAAAGLLGVRPARLYELARERRIPSVRLGVKQVRFPRRALLAWLDERALAAVVERTERRPPGAGRASARRARTW